jgi:hypothetical protein
VTRISSGGKRRGGFFAKRGGGPAFEAERIAKHIKFTHGNRRRERQCHASARELTLRHHLWDERHAQTAANHLGDCCELRSFRRELWPEMVRLQEFTNLGRQTVHFVQEEEFLRLEIAPLDLSPFCERMSP